MNSLIKERDKRTAKRKKAKEKFDRKINLALTPDKETDGLVRLLDEGTVVDAYGNAIFYLKKGTLQKFVNKENQYLENLKDSHIGTINLGHFDFAVFPFILGEWRLSDMSIADNGEGRKGLDISFNLDEDSIFVMEMRRQGIELGVSAEFYTHTDEEQSNELGIQVIDEILLENFAIVGECGNVGSSNTILAVEQKGDKMSVELRDFIEEQETEQLTVDDAQETEPATEDTTELSATDDEEEHVVELSGTAETEEQQLSECSTTTESEGSTAVDLNAILETINQLRADNSDLSTRLATLEQTNQELRAELDERIAKDKEFNDKFAELKVNLGVVEKIGEKTQSNYSWNGGIGVL